MLTTVVDSTMFPLMCVSAALAAVYLLEYAQRMGWLPDHASLKPGALLEVLERRTDLTGAERADLQVARTTLSAWSSWPYLTIVSVNGDIFIATAYNLVGSIWLRVFAEPLPLRRTIGSSLRHVRQRR